jgi:hypothetical protein
MGDEFNNAIESLQSFNRVIVGGHDEETMSSNDSGIGGGGASASITTTTTTTKTRTKLTSSSIFTDDEDDVENLNCSQNTSFTHHHNHSHNTSITFTSSSSSRRCLFSPPKYKQPRTPISYNNARAIVSPQSLSSSPLSSPTTTSFEAFSLDKIEETLAIQQQKQSQQQSSIIKQSLQIHLGQNHLFTSNCASEIISSTDVYSCVE